MNRLVLSSSTPAKDANDPGPTRVRTRMGRAWKTIALFGAVFAVGVIVGWVGYRLATHTSSPDEGTRVAVEGDATPWEYFASSASFSEVQTAKGDLRGMAWRYLSDLESRVGPLHRLPARTITAQESGTRDAGERVVQELRDGMMEFAGTSQEFIFRQHLLAVLRRWERHSEWTTVYLDLVYRHPMDPWVGRLAAQAVRAGREAGRLEEVVDALQWVASHPMAFEGKGAVQSALSPFSLHSERAEVPLAPKDSASHDADVVSGEASLMGSSRPSAGPGSSEALKPVRSSLGPIRPRPEGWGGLSPSAGGVRGEDRSA